MLTSATPSIFQQRIILVVFLIVIGLLGWRQNDGSARYAAHPIQKFSHARSADALDELDFTNAEASWSALQLDSEGNLQIDALTETALLDAMTLTQGHAPEQSMKRMAFLLEKQFGARASQQVMELLPKLKNYKEAEQRWWAENSSRDPPPHAELFDLQDDLLGEALAKQMFSEQRRLTNMMLASQQIRNDARLTQAEKERALSDLQKTDAAGARVE